MKINGSDIGLDSDDVPCIYVESTRKTMISEEQSSLRL